MSEPAPAIVRIEQALTFATVPALVTLPGRTSARSLRVDLGGVPSADSAGLALLVQWVKDARAGAQELRFGNVPRRLRDLMRVTGLEPFFADKIE